MSAGRPDSSEEPSKAAARVARTVARQTPYQAVQDRLRPRLDERVAELPRQWERLGDVLVLRGVRSRFGGHAGEAAQAYAETLGARLVLEDTAGVHGPRREPTMTRLWGTGSGETTFIQNRIRYTLDAERLMFSSGNLSERERMGRVDARGETVVDLFAGIGYFTLPLLVHAGARKAVACEINPLSMHYLQQNARDNQVADRLETRTGDCRKTAPWGIAHRVVSGWFPRGHRYLDTALAALRPDGGLLHYHDTARADRPHEELTNHLQSASARSGRELLDVQVRVVKSFSPGVVHAVADAQVGPTNKTPDAPPTQDPKASVPNRSPSLVEPPSS